MKSKSLSALHRLFWRHQIHRGLRLSGFVLCGLFLGYLCLLWLPAGTGLPASGINLLFLALATGGLTTLILALVPWWKDGFTIRRFYERWEETDPELANRSSLLVYSEQHEDEIDRLGYSLEFIQEDDTWLETYIQSHMEERRYPRCRWALLSAILCACLTGGLWIGIPEEMNKRAFAVWQALTIQGTDDKAIQIRVPDTLYVQRGDPVALRANLGSLEEARNASVHIRRGLRWESLKPRVDQDGTILIMIPSVQREIDYYIATAQALSNQGTILPKDPPSIVEGSIQVKPPEYTNLPEETISSWRPVAVPRGSELVLQGVASSELQSVTLLWNENAQPQQSITDRLTINIPGLYETSEFSLELTDSSGLSATTPGIRFTAIPDATPEIEWVQPRGDIVIPFEMVVRIQVHLKDDYGISNLFMHSQVNEDSENAAHELFWRYDPDQSGDIGGATDFFIAFEWDISNRELYPGDELTFYLEAFDNDGIQGPKAGRSTPITITYPSLSDLLGDLVEEEDEQIETLSEIVDEQRDIREAMEETLTRINEKQDMGGTSMDGGENSETWMEEQELQSLRDRQEELLERAGELEDQLTRYEESIQEQMTGEERENQGFTDETMEKLTRIQELVQELTNEDGQQMMQQFDEAMDEFSQSMDTSLLEQMQLSMEDMEDQLDRTLSMLEQTFEQRQMEGMQELMSDLAQQQEHLQRETAQLEAEQHQLAQERADLEARQQELAQESESGDSAQGDSDSSSGNEGSQNEDGSDSSEQNSNADDEDSPESSETSDEQQAIQDALNELAEREEALNEQAQQLAQRQQRLEEDVQDAQDEMQSMQESLQENNPTLAQHMEQVSQPMMQGQIQRMMQQASSQLSQGQTGDAQEQQQQAQEQLQQMAEQMQEAMQDMGMQSMQQDILALSRLMDRGLFLSTEMENLTESVRGQSEASAALRRANAFLREIRRVQAEWNAIAQSNPFADRAVGEQLRTSTDRLSTAVQAGGGERWVGLHETRQSTIALNQAIYQMMQDQQSMQQQMQQSGMQNFQQQMQQMISQQQQLNQMMEQMRQMGEQGQQMLQQLQQMMQQQQAIRRQLEQMMRQYRHARQLRNQMEGIYQEMREVEAMLEEGENGEEVREKQERILSRMLEAGTFQEDDEYGRERRAESPENEFDPESPDNDVPLDVPMTELDSIARPELERIPQAYRDAIREHFSRLSETMKQNMP